MTEAEKEKQYWLALLRAPKMTALRFWALLKHATVQDLFDHPKIAIKEWAPHAQAMEMLAYLKSPNWQAVASDIAWEQRSDLHHILPFYDARYPALLREIAVPPPVLFIQGQLSVLCSAQIAIVGSRQSTPLGNEMARYFSMGLAEKGMVITSGLAVGIDAAAHSGALSVSGKTVGVLGTGPERVYPVTNRDLFRRILDAGGAIITAYPVGVPVYPHYFRARNRIISGVSRGVLVVEAGLRSGALVTARYAAEQGREVFAVPGSPRHHLSRGCHALLKMGAKLTEDIADILEELMCYPDTLSTSARFILDKEAYKLLECVGFMPTTIGQIQARSGLCTQYAITQALYLAEQGYIVPVVGGYMRVHSSSSSFR